MKNSKLLILIVFVSTLSLFETQAAAQKSPSEVASEFYTLVVKEDPSGLPEQQSMRLFTPYLSRSLRLMFSHARQVQVEAIRKYPDEKPPLVDGCLFSCSYEGPKQFRLGKSRVAGRFAHVAVEQSVEGNGKFEWADTLILVKENGRWLVWDVRMGCEWPFRMGPTLRLMLSHK